MRVAHINLFDYPGGAARIGWILMNALTDRGHDAHIFAHRKTVNDPRVIAIPTPETSWQNKLLERERQRGLFDLSSTALLGVLRHPVFAQADVIHLHCINGGYFSFWLLPFLAAKPLVWTLHDPLAFTAGCYNTDFCNQWRQGMCADCPLDAQAGDGKKQRQLLQLMKGFIFRAADFTLVCPSQWLKKQTQASILKDHPVHLIYNGVDVETFKPGNRSLLRTKLGLPPDSPIIMFAAHGGFNDPRKGGRYLIEALNMLHGQYPELVLLNIGTYDKSILAGLPTRRIDMPFIEDQRLLAEFYGAADLFVAPALQEVFGLTVCEAQAAGTPVVAFAVGGIPEVVVHRETGYLAKLADSDDLARGIRTFLDDAALRERAGNAARLRVATLFSTKHMVDGYMELYNALMRGENPPVLPVASGPLPAVKTAETDMIMIADMVKEKSWSEVWQEFRQRYNRFAENESEARGIFTDQFCCNCLAALESVRQPAFWDILDTWLSCRNMPLRSGTLSAAEFGELKRFCQFLREKLDEYLAGTSLTELAALDEKWQWLLITLWRLLFLNFFSPLVLQQAGDGQGETNVAAAGWSDEKQAAGYPGLMQRSMYQPFITDKESIDVEELWNDAGIPICVKLILTFWLIHTPCYGVGEKQRQKLVNYAPVLCRAADMYLRQAKQPSIFIGLLQEMTYALWLTSYAGGNSLKVLSPFGDFVNSNMKRFFPEYPAAKPERCQTGEQGKIRIGYISRCFYSQAVSYYMMNRVIHHDRSKFEVYTFALGPTQDKVTEQFIFNSHCFKRFPDPYDIHNIAKSILGSRLDILIYADIGLEPALFMLAGLQLAPVQCALVGHGTTTGLPTIQYYISGDFEPADGQSHYREQLITLPNLGAAQYPPPFSGQALASRKDWSIPADVIVFVSCANGIKHIPERDMLLAEILKQAPNAWLILNPFYDSSGLDNRLMERIRSTAAARGVSDRLFIINPLKDAKEVMSLLAIADVQLDTFPYGGWTTNLEALYMGLPLVTQEGTMARNRWGAHMLRALGVQEGIAANESQYVEWAVRFAQDHNLRQKVKTQIVQHAKPTLFNGKEAQAAYEAVLCEIYDRHCKE
ncbi:glycosyltransferase [Methylomusa anaerophila]|uniref:D-inositol 3-phosphate glycosyltransferase n=1 Tax=Methylomusa anaerophila TaxID=1930071 RepID=A0A348ALJ2_9FIRM|nr:D-inositol 3-phosphate glycosyltransferase [Methylomusa anaerophila]